MSSSPGTPLSGSTGTSFCSRRYPGPLNVNCGCGFLLSVQTSQSIANPGRRFMSCPNRSENKCGFFIWVDDDCGDGPSDRELQLDLKMKVVEQKLLSCKTKNRRLKKANIFLIVLSTILFIISLIQYDVCR